MLATVHLRGFSFARQGLSACSVKDFPTGPGDKRASQTVYNRDNISLLFAPHHAGVEFFLNQREYLLAQPLPALLIRVAHQGTQDCSAADRPPGIIFGVLAE